MDGPGRKPDLNDEALRRLLDGLTAVRDGDFTIRLPEGQGGLLGEIGTVYNGMVEQLSLVTSEVTRVAREVGGQGLLGGHARVHRVSGIWQELATGVNTMADNLTSQVRSIAQVATAVANGDLTRKIRVEASGEILELKETINTMVDRLSSFAEEVTRVAREVGTEGKLGGQATVQGVSGTWKDLTDNVNSMADNLTNQVRNIAQVTTAVAGGDLTRRIDVSARGEILELKTTINTMVDQLSSFAAEVTRVAREVGTEGKLGGQAEVEGVSGTWKRLTENVNGLAGNLTRQVRAIAAVTSAVAEGDLTRSITVEAPGEVGELKDNINAMVESLRLTTRANEEQNWLKTNLARISGLLQGTRDLTALAQLITNEVSPLAGAQYGAFFLAETDDRGPYLVLRAAYGSPDDPTEPPRSFRFGQSLVGQCAGTRRVLSVDRLPPGYATIASGAGRAEPAALVVLPIVVEDQVLGVLELASLTPFTTIHRDFLDQVVETIGLSVSALIASARTDELLERSQDLTAELSARSGELQARQGELQRSNAELEEKAAQLADRNRDIERKNLEIEQARRELEVRAQQLSRTSLYKSEFLANMSHELRTPLNSLLILAQLLAQNPDGNLTEKQVDYAEVIHSAGSDLLQLINDILDLSKVEAGKMDVEVAPFPLRQLVEYCDATFQPVAAARALEFRIHTGPGLPEELHTDQARLRQVLRNLIANALKFTEQGHVELRVERAGPEEVPTGLDDTGGVLAFRVSDTGIGIAADRLDSVFAAFQQGEGSTSRHYGGTGLGLSISREVAGLLGGEIGTESVPGEGSVFTLYLPVRRAGPATPAAHPAGAATGSGTPAADPADGPAAGLAGRTVLVVDDDPRNVFALTEILRAEGVRVLRAEDGRSGLEVLAAHGEVDLVLMDVMMAGMDGYATTEAIRRMPAHAHVPIVVVTAQAMPGDRDKALAAGADDHVTKPVDAADLAARLRTWLR
ncbi:HAMP domain-containing protein [Streptomyces bambusae]|uniref:HAMP domain-containing protein n=1 Tax=Streptomyces bambusae TaxID=1550616 RepID=UPI001CFC7874|nr:HAMP domain-containing protein [Streptomyces bambusae]MCB5164237.1 HAMP domain-containing protein [Streptomyces bambusae]